MNLEYTGIIVNSDSDTRMVSLILKESWSMHRINYEQWITEYLTVTKSINDS
jgi:hypothetical protein